MKVHEARLTEKETTSLTPSEVEDYVSTLKVTNAASHTKGLRDDGAGPVRLLRFVFLFLV